jgi:hypothetical protein
MLRRLALALVAVFALCAGTAALTTDASARGGHGFHGHRGGGWHGGGFHRGGFHRGGFHRGWHRGGWHRGWHRGWYGPRRFYGGPRFYAPRFYGGYRGCYVRRLVPTPWGFRYRLINRCY